MPSRRDHHHVEKDKTFEHQCLAPMNAMRVRYSIAMGLGQNRYLDQPRTPERSRRTERPVLMGLNPTMLNSQAVPQSLSVCLI